MDVFGIGWQEILIVLFIALVVVGPQRLPQMAFKLGEIMRRLRVVTAEMTRNISDEVNQETRNLTPDMKDYREIEADIKDIKDIQNEKEDK